MFWHRRRLSLESKDLSSRSGCVTHELYELEKFVLVSLFLFPLLYANHSEELCHKLCLSVCCSLLKVSIEVMNLVHSLCLLIMIFNHLTF